MTKPKILIIYTGGTIGMIKDDEGSLLPFTFENLQNYIPLLESFPAEIDSYSFEPLIDSSDADTNFWLELSNVVVLNYFKYDGFVILHGSDTMAYTASALSFLLENLTKPVILTGSQLPLGLLRTDGRENIIAAIELASMQKDEKPLIQEVCIYFEDNLYRGNRTSKTSAEKFDAFQSPNYPQLAHVGTDINVFEDLLFRTKIDFMMQHKELCNDIAIIKLFPGIQAKTIKSILDTPDLKGLILETYGSGNAPTDEKIVSLFEEAINKGIIILNITQCTTGKVRQGKYATSKRLKKMGVISGKDMTTEAAVAKLMFLLAKDFSKKEIEKLLTISLRGEIS